VVRKARLLHAVGARYRLLVLLDVGRRVHSVEGLSVVGRVRLLASVVLLQVLRQALLVGVAGFLESGSWEGVSRWVVGRVSVVENSSEAVLLGFSEAGLELVDG